MPTKRYKLVYLTPAEQDIREIIKFQITQVGVQSARGIYQNIRQTILRLRDFPLIGQIHPDPLLVAENYRKLVLTNTYVAVYRVNGDTVYIYRVVNGTTDYPRLLK